MNRTGCLWTGVGAIGGILLITSVLVIGRLRAEGMERGQEPTPVLTIFPLPTSTSTPTITPTPRDTPTSTPSPIVGPGSGGNLELGTLVEISGTQGDGLRFRESPGLDGGIKFLGLEHEVFEVQDGPVDADGYIWWYLVNPYDPSKTGWAVSAFLQPFSTP